MPASRRELAAERRLTTEKVKRLDQAILSAEQKAEAANAATGDLVAKHNDLIRKGEEKEDEFADKGEVERLRDTLAEALGKEEYERRHAELQRQITTLSEWRANVTGRAIGLAVVGGIFIAATSAEITHLIA